MRVLLDTHVALWALTDDGRLPAAARRLIAVPDNEVWVSAVSVWEVAIKHRLSSTLGRATCLFLAAKR
jgi:PIN domain nuclease of toxin-antitoxin system